jgi:hypothetical protein
MNTIKYHSFIAVGTFLGGLVFFAVYNQWIIFYPSWRSAIMETSSDMVHKKHVEYHFFSGDKWKTEKQDMLWHSSIEKNIFHLINGLLILFDEEHITLKKTTVQSALITSAGHVYLSFDHNILSKEDTIFRKWMVIESILKTIRLNDSTLCRVQFLVQHQLLQDTHLDFSLPWPIQGFMRDDSTNII